jgi:hypothetical protein
MDFINNISNEFEWDILNELKTNFEILIKLLVQL